MPISEYLRNLRSKIGHDPVLIPGVTAVVFNDAGQVLLQRSREDGRWYVPGGAMDPDEHPAEAGVRAVQEESGLHVEPRRLIGVYAEEPVKYANGDVVHYVSTAFACGVVGGILGVGDDESLELRFFAPDALPELLPMHRARVDHALAGEGGANFFWTGTWQRS